MISDLLPEGQLGVRTKFVVPLIADRIAAKREDLAEQSTDFAKAVLDATGIKSSETDRKGSDEGTLATGYLVFIANRELDDLATSPFPGQTGESIPRSLTASRRRTSRRRSRGSRRLTSPCSVACSPMRPTSTSMRAHRSRMPSRSTRSPRSMTTSPPWMTARQMIFLYAVPLYPTADAKKFNIRLCCFTCRYIKNCKVECLKPFCPSRQKKFESCRRERFGLSWAAGVLHPDEQHGVVLVQRRRAVLEAVFQRSRAHRRDLEAWLALVVLGGGVLLHQVQRGLELAGRHT